VQRSSSSASTRRLALTWYTALGDLLDLLALLQSTFNFILYCLMSGQFRAELCNVVGVCRRRGDASDVARTPLSNSTARRRPPMSSVARDTSGNEIML